MDTLSQQRLASVLSATYSDIEIRNALSVLDARAIKNSPEARRQLRVHVRDDVIQSNARIVQDFSSIAEQLMRIGSTLDSMESVIWSMRSRVAAASLDTVPVLEESKALVHQKKDTQAKEVLLSAFAAHFIVPEEEIVVLTSSAQPVDDEFFHVLRKVKRIHGDCELLLASENQRVGMEIMEQMGRHLHAAFQKLYHWVQREFKNLSLESPQMNSGIRRALRALAERPTLFQNCLDFFAEARQRVLFDSFYTALTGASSNSGSTSFDHTSKPIELYAHDPLRYIGDMLAWLHSAVVGEQEALEVLFVAQEGDGEGQRSILGGIEQGLKDEPWAGNRDADADEFGWDARRGLMLLVDKDLETVCQPLKARVEQAIASHEDSTLSYRISNLIKFYHLTFKKILGVESSTMKLTETLEEFAIRKFYSTLHGHIKVIESELHEPPVDLSAPTFLLEALSHLHQLMISYDTSLAPVEAREEEFSNILDQALEPYLKCCKSLGQSLEVNTVQTSIFTLNCILATVPVLEQFPFTKERLASLRQETRMYKDALVHHVHEFFITSSGLEPLLTGLSEWDTSKPLEHVPAFTPVNLAYISQTLDEFLPTALIDIRAELGKLSSTRVIDEIAQSAAEQFVQDFRRVEEGLMANQASTESALMDFWPRTTEEVQVLLS